MAVIRNDDHINARSDELEERCYHLIALQAPVARDVDPGSGFQRHGEARPLGVTLCPWSIRVRS